METRTVKTGVAATLAGLALALAPGSPAAAHPLTGGPGGTVTPIGLLVSDGWRLDLYVDRPITQRLAAIARAWDKSLDAPAEVLAGVLCRNVPTPVGVALCAGAVTLAGSYPLDQLQAADRIGGCLRLAIVFGLPEISAYDDAGEYCRGRRV